MLADDARATAAALDERRKNGQPLGALHGVPIALKDLRWTVDDACGRPPLTSPPCCREKEPAHRHRLGASGNQPRGFRY